MPATTPIPARPGPVRRAGRWLNAHPLVVVGALLVAALAQVVTYAADGRWELLFFPAVTAGAAGVLLYRDFARTTGDAWVVPRGWSRPHRVLLADIDHVEVSASPWSLDAATLVLRDGQRVTLRGVDRLNATAIAEQAGVEVRRF